MPLIAFEGPEGVGKTTQLRMLAELMAAAGRDVVAVREPGGTPLGDEIRRLLLDPASDIVPRAEGLLFMASRAQLVERQIVPALSAGATVLLDRFFLSTYAYQVAGRRLAHEQVDAANRLAIGALRPDLTLLLMLPVEDGLARAAKRGPNDRMEQADAEFHRRVAGAFEVFAGADWQAAHPEVGRILTIDATGAVEDVLGRVRAAVQSAGL